jgi:hypothetical protein
MCPTANGFRDRAISLCTVLTSNTLGCEADHSFTSAAKVKNASNYTSTPAVSQLKRLAAGLPTVAARVRVRVWSSRICSGQSGAEAGFLRVLRFPLAIFIPPNYPPSQSPWAATIGQKWPTYRLDPAWTPPLSNMRINKKVTAIMFH